MTTVQHSAPLGVTSFPIYEDPEDQELASPMEMFEGDMSFGSELSRPADEAMPSIELERELDDSEPEPYRSSYTSRKSISQPRRSSGVTQYSFISAIPSESSVSSKPITPATDVVGTRYTPQKERPRFRNTDSVRALHMSSPPPLPAYEAPVERTKASYKLATPSRMGRSETPVSRRSGSRRRSIREHQSPRPAPPPQQAPLVLLHVTILPMQLPYSHEMMVRIMPEWLVENYKLLEEKLQDIILMRRGLLIPHPRDEYDLLEERILESLELKLPRISKCGHFVPPEDETDPEDDDDAASVTDDGTGPGSRMSGGTLTDENKSERNMSVVDDPSICMDCHHELKRPGKGVGAGTRKWDIKIYAANGLMRAAAWGACWNDMERCDVEISPWIPDKVRKSLERKAKEEHEAQKHKQMYAAELQRQIKEAAAKQSVLEEEAAEKKRSEEIELQRSFDAAAAALQRSVEEKAAEKKRFEETLAEKIEEAKETVRHKLEAQALAESSIVAERFRALEEAFKEQKKDIPQAPEMRRPTSRHSHAAHVPLSTLIKNYVLVLLGDRKNLVILSLSALVVFLSLNVDANWRQQILPLQLAGMPNKDLVLPPVSTITVTTTARSYPTLVVSETHTVTILQQATSPPLVSMELPSGAAETVPTGVQSLLPSSSSVEEEAYTATEEVPLGSETAVSMPTSPAVEIMEPAEDYSAVAQLETKGPLSEAVESPVTENIKDDEPKSSASLPTSPAGESAPFAEGSSTVVELETEERRWEAVESTVIDAIKNEGDELAASMPTSPAVNQEPFDGYPAIAELNTELPRSEAVEVPSTDDVNDDESTPPTPQFQNSTFEAPLAFCAPEEF